MPELETLKRLSGAPEPRSFCVVDIEARNWVEPYAVGFFDGLDYQQFDGFGRCIRAFLDGVLRSEFAGKWIYAHNGGNYDFLFLMREILRLDYRHKYRVEITPTGSTIIRLDVIAIVEGKHEKGCADAKCQGCEPIKDRKKKPQRWSFLDSAKLMPLPLADLGETFGITKKIKLQMSYNALALPQNHAIMSNYLKTDCVSLYQAIDLMQRRINDLGGQIGVTLPATSLDLYRRRFQYRDVFVNRHWINCPEYRVEPKDQRSDRCIVADKTNESSCMHEYIRKAYFGGPAQIFRTTFVGAKAIERDNEARQFQTEGERVKHGLPRYLLTDEERSSFDLRFPVAKMYDINSHYPACMLEPMPVGEAIEFTDLPEQSIYSNAMNFVGIVEADVEIPGDCYLPPLPVEHEGKLMFPAGRLRGVWDAQELRLLPLVGGRINKTYRSVWFEQEPIFVDFIREIYKLRDKSQADWNKGLDWLAKILMNSAYGKYAMRVLRTMVLVRPEAHEGMTPLDFDSDVWSEDVMIAPNYIVPQLAVHIVALARCRLWKLNNRVITEGGRLYYNDTDSLVCSGIELPVGPGLGALKLESTIHRAQFVLPKLYLVETEEADKKKTEEAHLRIKSKGMGPGIRIDEEGDDPLAKQLSEEEFVKVTREGGEVVRHRLTKLAEGLRDYAKSKLEFPRIIESTKSIQSAYDKRTMRGDFDTEPLYLSHW